jgi:hypothetical protein
MCILGAGTSIADAQPEIRPRPEIMRPGPDNAFEIPDVGPGNPRAREVLEKVLIARLSEDLALDDAQTVLLVRRYTEVREKLAALRQQRQEKMRELREAVEANEDNDKLTSMLEGLQALDREMEKTKQAAFDTMSVDLTPWQKARLYIFFSEFEAQMRRWLMEVRRERAGQRGPGEGRPAPRSDKPERPEKPK